jgi:hypothetical protein
MNKKENESKVRGVTLIQFSEKDEEDGGRDTHSDIGPEDGDRLTDGVEVIVDVGDAKCVDYLKDSGEIESLTHERFRPHRVIWTRYWTSRHRTRLGCYSARTVYFSLRMLTVMMVPMQAI